MMDSLTLVNGFILVFAVLNLAEGDKKLSRKSAASLQDWTKQLIFRHKRQSGSKKSLTPDEKGKLVDLHNEVRRIPKSTDMSLLKWDEGLATLAQKWADECKFDHNPNRKNVVPGFTEVGENIFAETNEPHMQKVVDSWYDEVVSYDYDTGQCQGMCGHYTQVVWAKTHSIGCGVRFCPSIAGLGWPEGGYMVVCDYGPGGNIIGEKPYIAGSPPCSACHSKESKCAKGLCSGVIDPEESTGDKDTGRKDPDAPKDTNMTEADKKLIVNRHNELRRIPQSTDMSLLRWDQNLADFAQKWADQCVWNHNPKRTDAVKGYRYVGENVDLTADPPNFGKIIDNWYDEVYSYDLGECIGACGRYTQIVWAKTRFIGCAVKYCTSMKNAEIPHGAYFFVCNYGPGGNYIGRRPYTRGAPVCSACTGDRVSCIEGLCDGQDDESKNRNPFPDSSIPHSDPGNQFNDNGLTKEGQERILDKHNELRRIPDSTNMNLLYWDDNLAKMAQRWAGRCQWKHNPNRRNVVRGFVDVGENIYASTESPDMAKVVATWYSEIKDYYYERNHCDAICGHYTQVVWAKSYALGCGVVRCPTIQGFNWPNGGYIVVCNYGPSGNYIGQSPYIKGSPSCSACETGRDTCVEGLCDGEPGYNPEQNEQQKDKFRDARPQTGSGSQSLSKTHLLLSALLLLAVWLRS